MLKKLAEKADMEASFAAPQRPALSFREEALRRRQQEPRIESTPKHQAHNVVKLLEELKGESMTADEICARIPGLNLTKNSPVYEELKKSTNVITTEIVGTTNIKFSLKRKFEAINYDTLKDLIKGQINGIPRDELSIIYDGAGEDIERLLKENEITEFEKVLYSNIPEYVVPIEIKEHLRNYWTAIPMPISTIDLNKRLRDLGLQEAKKEVIKRNDSKNSKKRKPRKISNRQNAHMNN